MTAALERAGDNRPEIEEFLASQQGERLEAARFLVANLPTVDLVTMSAKDLQENLDYAFAAYEDLPWSGKVPFNLFLHYVLPPRVTEEPYQPWRPILFRELKDELKGCRTMTDAAIAINRWCGQRVRFKQTEFRDQNALSTLKSGIGRCEEMMIVSIDAMRSMGIPARACSAPWWVVNDNNHAWVEIWADGKWHYIGGCEPADALDKAWFSSAAQRAGIVTSYMFGSPDDHPTGEAVARKYENMAVINSTAVYAGTDRVTVTVTDSEGNPVADCPVSLSAFNYGALRSLLRQNTDDQGRTVLTVGMGDYFLSAGNDKGRAYAIVHSTPGADTLMNLELTPGAAPPAEFWLHYPTPAEAARAKARFSAGDSTRPVAEYTPQLPDPPQPDFYEPGKDPQLDELVEQSGHADQWKAILQDSFANWHETAMTLKAIPAELREDLFQFMQRTRRVDRLELKAPTALDHVSWAAAHRPRNINDSLYYDYILNGRIEYEHLTPWRYRIASLLSGLKADDPLETAKNVNKYFAENITDDSNRNFGRATRMNPVQVLTARRGKAREIAVAAVGVLRTFSIPARKSTTRSTVEFYDGGQWRVFDPLVEDSIKILAEDNAETETDKEDVELPVKLHLRFVKDGKTFTDWGKITPHFDISRFSNGGWEPLRRTDGGPQGDEIVITLPADEYLVSAGVRNGNGDPYVRTWMVNPQAGENVTITIPFDLPQDAGIFRFEKVRKLESLPGISLPRPDGSTASLSEVVQDHAVLLYFFRLDHEPSVRMLRIINDAAPELNSRGAEVVCVLLPAEGGISLDKALSGAAPAFTLVKENTDTPAYMHLSPAEKGGESYWKLPSVLFLNKGGDVIMWTEGYDLNLGTLLHYAARQVR
ncbi:MAG TPA: hypothetical protein ENJ06_02815 [Phycisphaeraceae bacterium]|nr:hypothetical protein [Phycisphaeraceae bacterium]